jgi:hypothetical protein
MAAWAKCTTTKGEVMYLNLEQAITLAQRGIRKETTVCFSNADPIEVRETPEELVANSAAGRGLRRGDVS